MNEVEAVARAICAADGHDFDEVCGVDANPDEGYCDSGTCVASCWEEHDAEQARRWYRHIAQAAIAALDAARGDPVARVVEWLRNGGGTDISQLSGSTQMLFLKGMNRYADAIERGEPFRD